MAIVVATLAASMPATAGAQSLRGSSSAVARAYKVARAHNLTFVETPDAIGKLIEAGRLVKIAPGKDVALHRVSHPYALPATVSFINRLAAGYHEGCGEQLVVTSLTRPVSKQPKNASSRSVHPAGMAVDIRRSKSSKCRDWLEKVLLDLELDGVIEATREKRPPHYHVAVFPTKYMAFIDRLGKGEAAHRAPSDETPVPYSVQTGESLWSIARKLGTTVERIKALNKLSEERIDAGQLLLVPPVRRDSHESDAKTTDDGEGGSDVGG